MCHFTPRKPTIIQLRPPPRHHRSPHSPHSSTFNLLVSATQRTASSSIPTISNSHHATTTPPNPPNPPIPSNCNYSIRPPTSGNIGVQTHHCNDNGHAHQRIHAQHQSIRVHHCKIYYLVPTTPLSPNPQEMSDLTTLNNSIDARLPRNEISSNSA